MGMEYDERYGFIDWKVRAEIVMDKALGELAALDSDLAAAISSGNPIIWEQLHELQAYIGMARADLMRHKDIFDQYPRLLYRHALALASKSQEE